MDIRCGICGSRLLHLEDKEKQKYRCRCCDNVFIYTPVKAVAVNAKYIYKECIDSIVEINSYFNNESAFGTGFYISDNGYIVTNAHMLLNQTKDNRFEMAKSVYSVKNHSDDYEELVLEFIDPKNDLALLKVQRSINSKPLRISEAEIEIGDPIYTIGNSKGDGLLLLDGIVSDIGRVFGDHDVFVFTAAVTEGCSGGPVINSSGEVCGVIVGGVTNVSSMNYAIPNTIIRNFIFRAKSEKNLNC